MMQYRDEHGVASDARFALLIGDRVSGLVPV